MSYYAQKLDESIDQIINEVHSSDILCYGMSASLYQWVCSSIIAEKIKGKYPESIIVIGGIGTRESAIKYLETFSAFDFVIWGEGKNALFQLCNQLQNSSAINIPNIAFREKDTVKVSDNLRIIYTDIKDSNLRPEYSDYFLQKDKCVYLNTIKSYVGIEAGRGCHWKKCHFCYLNSEYKYRQKPVKIIIEEILWVIKNHNTYNFTFLDNDIIGANFERYELFLDELIKLKETYPDFNILMAEVITHGVNASILKKMSLAGFKNVQIGYESTSNRLLKKIRKKNSFASNLLLIKFAFLYCIYIDNANIIMGLIEETSDDIIEAIENLHYLRFFLKDGIFRHSFVGIEVMRTSPYFKYIKEDKSGWKRNNMFDQYLSCNYVKIGDNNADIIEYCRKEQDPLWDKFRITEGYYLKNNYEYKILDKGSSLLYKEYFNSIVISEFEIETNSLDYYILNFANESVIEISQLLELIRSNFNSKTLYLEIINTLEELKTEKLLYVSEDYSEIISIINLNQKI